MNRETVPVVCCAYTHNGSTVFAVSDRAHHLEVNNRVADDSIHVVYTNGHLLPMLEGVIAELEGFCLDGIVPNIDAAKSLVFHRMCLKFLTGEVILCSKKEIRWISDKHGAHRVVQVACGEGCEELQAVLDQGPDIDTLQRLLKKHISPDGNALVMTL
ncbi:MAG: hypothetical protein ACYCOU_24690 [Sulfobacillus sp.]